MKVFRLVFFCAFLVSLVGCVATAPFQKASVEQGKSLIYIFRPESLLSRGTLLKLDVNGETRGVLVNNGYLPVQVMPGATTLTLLTNDFVNNKFDALTLSAENGETYFVKAEPGLWGAFTLKQLDTQAGLAEVGSTVYYQTK